MSTGKLQSQGDLLNLRSEMASVRDLLDGDDQGQGIFTPMKNKCPAEVNFDTNGTPYGIHCSVCVVKAREE